MIIPDLTRVKFLNNLESASVLRLFPIDRKIRFIKLSPYVQHSESKSPSFSSYLEVKASCKGVDCVVELIKGAWDK